MKIKQAFIKAITGNSYPQLNSTILFPFSLHESSIVDGEEVNKLVSPESKPTLYPSMYRRRTRTLTKLEKDFNIKDNNIMGVVTALYEDNGTMMVTVTYGWKEHTKTIEMKADDVVVVDRVAYCDPTLIELKEGEETLVSANTHIVHTLEDGTRIVAVDYGDVQTSIVEMMVKDLISDNVHLLMFDALTEKEIAYVKDNAALPPNTNIYVYEKGDTEFFACDPNKEKYNSPQQMLSGLGFPQAEDEEPVKMEFGVFDKEDIKNFDPKDKTDAPIDPIDFLDIPEIQDILRPEKNKNFFTPTTLRNLDSEALIIASKEELKRYTNNATQHLIWLLEQHMGKQFPTELVDKATTSLRLVLMEDDLRKYFRDIEN